MSGAAAGAERRILAATRCEPSEDGDEALWELKPAERNWDARSSKSSAPVEVETRSRFLCGMPFFGGCTMCTLHEDEVIRPYTQWEPIPEKGWEPGDLLCSSSARRCGTRGSDEYIEDVEESASTGSCDDVAAEEASGTRYQKCPPGMVQRGIDDLQETPLLQEVEAFMWVIGDIFVARGWLLEALSGDRFRLNGRTIKFLLRPLGTAPPPSARLLRAVGAELAEQAACFLVCDGSLRQPLLDYLLQTGENESYDQRGTENIAGVDDVGKMLDFNIASTGDRILEMKSAKIQADLRRSASGLGAGAPRASALQSEGAKLLNVRGSLLQTFQQPQVPVHGV